MTRNKWIDISQPLSADIAHWPGDTPFKYETAFSKLQTGSVNIGKITTSLHTGTHVDAPFHFDDSGEKILELDFEVFMGKARVIDVSAFTKVNTEVLKRFNLDWVERVLLKTSTPNNPRVFPNQIQLLDPDIAPYLGEKGIRLLGVDVPSVDQLDSMEMATHHGLYTHGVHILENIMLDEVEEGDYELIALPLPLKDADGSPVRAVLRKI